MTEQEDGSEGGPRLGKWVDERECYEEIAEYIKEVDEILDFIKPFPRDRFQEPENAPLRSSHGQESDHLGNLIKLVEQLKELKEKDSKMNERAEYLKELKKLRERKKLLKYEAELGATPRYWGPKEEEKAKTSTPFRKTNRGRSKSVNMDEMVTDRFGFPDEQRRKLSTGSPKPKVSKWTKVKEAFKWEKASVDGERKDEVHYLRVPQDKTPESLSDSPVSGQISGSSSVGAPSTICLAVSSGYSGEHSSEGHSTSSGCGIDLPVPPPPPTTMEEDFLSLPLIQDMSSSSSSEKLDELINYSELLSKGNDKSDLIGDSFDVAFQDDRGVDDLESRRSKSLDDETPPNPSLAQHLSKESLAYSKKSHKTAWGKVKDIIQTRKDSLKKKPKKRNCEKGDDAFDPEAQEDPSSPDEKTVALFKPKIELTESQEEIINKPTGDLVTGRRLTPVLTITLPSTEELRNISSDGDAPAHTTEDKNKISGEAVDYFEDIPKYEKSKAGSYHRFSKWSKVKRAFLTNPSRSDYMPEASSVPSSPNKQMSFFWDMESDELSSGEWTDKIHEKAAAESESLGTVSRGEIQKHYLELSHKLTQEFDQKMREWERMKSETKKHEGPFQRQKSEEWDKIPRCTRQRESMTIPLPKLDDLSPEFKKKLDEWKKIKKSQTIPSVPGTSPKDETQAQNFKMRMGEWQRWRPRSNHKMSKTEQSDEFAKKLEEWQRIKGTARRSRSQSDRGKDRTPSPCLRRKNSKKKTTGSGKSSGTESLSGSLKEKDGRGNRKQQKEKDLQWLEKELHKIERGKMRLEREKEKFLEREARLEKMKRTMGTTSPTQEILIKTPTGFFRFEGISQKFTKKLYEWEKARGIAPEASTFALLEECASRSERDDTRSMSLQRSKSMGSVMEVSSTPQDMPHHPSSLSLNDVDELGGIEELRTPSEPGRDEDEPQAIIVDVEDVVEETAALMADAPEVKTEIPVYSYAPKEVTQLIDSSDSEDETRIRIFEEPAVKEPKEEVTGSTSRKISEGSGGDSPMNKNFEPGSRYPEKMNQQEAVSHVHELSSQLLCLAEKLEMALSNRGDDKRVIKNALYNRRKQAQALKMGELLHDPKDDDKSSLQELVKLPSLITNKVLELKSGLNVLKSATESPGQESRIFEYPKSDSEKLTEEEETRSLEKLRAQVLYGESVDVEYESRRAESRKSPELIKKKIKEKISLMQRMTTETRPNYFKLEENEGVEDEKVVVVKKSNNAGGKQKLLKTRRITDTTIVYSQKEDALAETKNNYYSVQGNTDKTPVNVFVPTTRKIISPVRRDSKGTTSILSYVIDDITPKEGAGKAEKLEAQPEAPPEKAKDIGIPPLPNSPISPRKLTSPGIRMMIAKYNQKMEQSGAGKSSLSWRSPILERKLPDPAIQKSASLGLMKSDQKPLQDPLKGILKSASAGAVKEPDMTASTLRALRIKKAKEEFLSRGPETFTSAAASTATTESPSNRLSHLSVGSESSYDDASDSKLIKSASAGAINVEDTNRRSSDVDRSDESVKTTTASSKFGIFSIKSRFRKVRMKKSKESGAVSTLCRQSLLLEVPVGPEVSPCTSKSCPSSPVLERSKVKADTWMRSVFRKDPKPEVP